MYALLSPMTSAIQHAHYVLLLLVLILSSSFAEQSCTVAAPQGCKVTRGHGSTDSVLIQRDVFNSSSREKKKLSNGDQPEFVNGSKVPPLLSKAFDLCHPTIVTQTCLRLNDMTDASETVERISLARVKSILAINDSLLDSFSSKAELHVENETVACADLCLRVIDYIGRVGVLPPSSDVACYTLNGQHVCDVDVNPRRLVERVAASVGARPDKGPMVEIDNRGTRASEVDMVGEESNTNNSTFGLIQRIVVTDNTGLQSTLFSLDSSMGSHTNHLGRRSARTPSTKFCPYTLWEVVERIANFFRIFPASGEDLRLWLGGLDNGSLALAQHSRGLATENVANVIASANVQAKAWISTVVVELANWNTQAFREKWFGGSGTLSRNEVRDRVSLAMNFIERELDGIRYVYPADRALGSACKGNVVAYVWKWDTDERGYLETRGPKCSEADDPLTKNCAVDFKGNYFVYLCERWYSQNENGKIATLVHEAAHHSGPTDITYDKEDMKELRQSEQLDNAANYERFAQDVAQSAWGCADSAQVVGLPFTCTPSPCTCSNFQGYCNDGNWGMAVRDQCPATCGYCQAPGIQPTPAATPAPTPLEAAVDSKGRPVEPTPEPTPEPTRLDDAVDGKGR